MSSDSAARMVLGVDDGVAERVNTGDTHAGPGESCIRENGRGRSETIHGSTSGPCVSTDASLVAMCSSTGCGSEGQTLATPGVSSVQIEVSYAFLPPISSSEVAVAIASSQGVNYQSAVACYASSWGRGEQTGGIDVGRQQTRLMTQLGGSDGLDEARSAVEPSQMRPQDSGGGPLSDILTGRRELDMVMRQADREDGSLRWLQALDLQVLGACRTDELLNPFLGWNTPCLGSDDQLLAHLGQHFKRRELGQLARCLCAPLVSVRVGKVLQHRCTLRPINTRGYLSLTMLPSSELRLSFVGDNGVLERLAVMSPNSRTISVALEELAEDSSSRTFVLKLPEGKRTYFWQSEKSKVRGEERIAKMKDLLTRQPTLSELTGIQDLRLNLLASHVRSAVSSTPTHLQSSWVASSGIAARDNTSRQRDSSQLSTSGSSSMQIPWHHMSQMSLGESMQQPGGFTSLAGSTSSIFQTGQAWSAAVADSLNSRFVPSVVGRPRCSDPVCSSATCITSASSVSVGYSTSSLRNALDVGSIQNSWSTRTSVWSNQDDGVGLPTSHSAGLYTSLQHVPSVQRDGPNLSVTHSFLDLQVDPSTGSTLPLSSVVSSVIPYSIPPPSPFIPLSTSLLTPYYCPCPLSTPGLHYSFAPSHLPAAVRESSLVQPSTSVISFLPSLVPQTVTRTVGSPESCVANPVLPAAVLTDSSHIPVLWTSSSSPGCSQEGSSTSQSVSLCQDQPLSAKSTRHHSSISWEETQAAVSGVQNAEQPGKSCINDP